MLLDQSGNEGDGGPRCPGVEHDLVVGDHVGAGRPEHRQELIGRGLARVGARGEGQRIEIEAVSIAHGGALEMAGAGEQVVPGPGRRQPFGGEPVLAIPEQGEIGIGGQREELAADRVLGQQRGDEIGDQGAGDGGVDRCERPEVAALGEFGHPDRIEERQIGRAALGDGVHQPIAQLGLLDHLEAEADRSVRMLAVPAQGAPAASASTSVAPGP